MPSWISGLYHAVRLKIHRRMCLDMVAFVDGAGKVNGIVFVTVDAEDFLRPGLDLANVIHQLAAIGMPREPVNGVDLEVYRNSSFSGQGVPRAILSGCGVPVCHLPGTRQRQVHFSHLLRG